MKMFKTISPRHDSLGHSAAVCKFDSRPMAILANPQRIVQAVHAKAKHSLTLSIRK
jgi:hypothetical protein